MRDGADRLPSTQLEGVSVRSWSARSVARLVASHAGARAGCRVHTSSAGAYHADDRPPARRPGRRRGRRRRGQGAPGTRFATTGGRRRVRRLRADRPGRLPVGRNGGRVSGQVLPGHVEGAGGVPARATGETLRARWFTDHDPTTDAGALTEVTGPEDNGFFDFKAEPVHSARSTPVEVSPRAVVGDEVSAARRARRSYFTTSRWVSARGGRGVQSLTGKVTGPGGGGAPGDTQVEEPCSDLQTVRLLRRLDSQPAAR